MKGINTMNTSRFTVTNGKGFHLTFDNNWTASIQFEEGNYSDGESTAEVAAWFNDYSMPNWHQKIWLDFGDNTVKGWLSTNEVASFISAVANFPSNKTPQIRFVNLELMTPESLGAFNKWVWNT